MKGTAFVIGYARSRSGSGKRHEVPGQSVEQQLRSYHAVLCELFHKK